MASQPPTNLSLRPGNPDFLDLPWDFPLEQWSQHCARREQVPRGLSRHPVEFVNYSGIVYAFKEMPLNLAESEYNLLLHMEGIRLPSVTPVGYAATNTAQGERSVLITRFLDRSLPQAPVI